MSLFRIFVLIAKFEVVRPPQPDDGLGYGVDKIVVFTVGKLCALTDYGLYPVSIHVPHATLLE